jgi:hypothetical protein
MISSWISLKARKGLSSDIAGRGLFAIERIDAGEIVAVKGGHIVTTGQLQDLPDPLPNSEACCAPCSPLTSHQRHRRYEMHYASSTFTSQPPSTKRVCCQRQPENSRQMSKI